MGAVPEDRRPKPIDFTGVVAPPAAAPAPPAPPQRTWLPAVISGGMVLIAVVLSWRVLVWDPENADPNSGMGAVAQPASISDEAPMRGLGAFRSRGTGGAERSQPAATGQAIDIVPLAYARAEDVDRAFGQPVSTEPLAVPADQQPAESRDYRLKDGTRVTVRLFQGQARDFTILRTVGPASPEKAVELVGINAMQLQPGRGSAMARYWTGMVGAHRLQELSASNGGGTEWTSVQVKFEGSL